MDAETEVAKVRDQRVKRVIAEQLGIDLSTVTDEASFAADFDTDSLDEVELVMALEDEFNIEIPDEDLTGCVTVADAVRLVNKFLPA